MDRHIKIKGKIRTGSLAFDIVNYIFLGILALSCILPLVHVLAISFSVSWAAQGGMVYLWPVEPNLESYKFLVRSGKFVTAFWISVQRLAIGVAVNLFLTIITAYPLSKEPREFKGRTVYVWFLFITMLFSGGLIPTYMTIRSYGLLDKLLVLVLPGAVPVFSVILMLNFFRQLPREVEEAALIDGAGFYTTLWRVIVPMSRPSIATVALFSAVGHWNSWFDGLIYMNSPVRYPLQSYLRVMIESATVSRELLLAMPEMAELLKMINDNTLKSAQIFLGALPIIMVYPFLQRYFMKGIVLGSVKG